LDNIFETIDQRFADIEKISEIVSLGVDYRRFKKFEILIAKAYRNIDG
jgi:hypothetical protein